MIVNINVISGFLGAGKTTFLKKILPYIDGQIAIIENEFGDAGLDGILISSENCIPVREIYSGCICCSLAKDLKNTVCELVSEYKPNHIFIEPSGVASLSDIIKFFNSLSLNENFSLNLNYIITIVDALSYEDSLESFGSFYMDQITNAKALFLSHLDTLNPIKIENILSELKLHNPNAFIFADNWLEMDDDHLIESLYLLEDVDSNTLKNFNENKKSVQFEASDIFESYSIKNPKSFMESELDQISDFLKNTSNGTILRSKGIIKLNNNKLVHFNFTPKSFKWEFTDINTTPKIVIIGSKLDSIKLSNYFQGKTFKNLL